MQTSEITVPDFPAYDFLVMIKFSDLLLRYREIMYHSLLKYSVFFWTVVMNLTSREKVE
jgi:hypothetical protein